jgi:FtsZ-interacting cell division protein ZipA
MDYGTIVALIVVIGMLAVQVWNNREDRKKFSKREDMLYAAILAKDPAQYAALHDSIKMDPKDKERIMRLENELAIKAAEIEKDMQRNAGVKVS